VVGAAPLCGRVVWCIEPSCSLSLSRFVVRGAYSLFPSYTLILYHHTHHTCTRGTLSLHIRIHTPTKINSKTVYYCSRDCQVNGEFLWFACFIALSHTLICLLLFTLFHRGWTYIDWKNHKKDCVKHGGNVLPSEKSAHSGHLNEIVQKLQNEMLKDGGGSERKK
jgi:hypothetical protein